MSRPPPARAAEGSGYSNGRMNGAQHDPIVVDDDNDEVYEREQAQKRRDADLKKHAYVAPVPERIQDDWQVAYTWAFLNKFELRGRVKRLESLEDLERSLLEPVANRPDDVLEGLLIMFLKNLKPGLRNLGPENIQTQLTNYISDKLHSSPEFTVWDRPWAPNEEARGPCCSEAVDRLELGRLRGAYEAPNDRVQRNPLLIAAAHGGGLFEMEWWERSKLLRQMVDWQLTHCDEIRKAIQALKPTGRKTPENGDPRKTEPIGLDRNKLRIWSFDSSPRLYASGNPFKRPCPLKAITLTRAELQAEQERYAAHGATKAVKPKGSGANGRLTTKENAAHKKNVKGIEDEKKLAVWIAEDLVPRAEKEEARVHRQRKKIADAMMALQAAELRTTRTRRPARKIDYTYDMSEEDEPRRGRSGGSGAYEPDVDRDHRGRLIIPGERRSARVRKRDEVDEDSFDEGTTVSAVPSRQPTSSPQPNHTREVFPEGTKRVKGYAYVAASSPADSASPPYANGS